MNQRRKLTNRMTFLDYVRSQVSAAALILYSTMAAAAILSIVSAIIGELWPKSKEERKSKRWKLICASIVLGGIPGLAFLQVYKDFEDEKQRKLAIKSEVKTQLRRAGISQSPERMSEEASNQIDSGLEKMKEALRDKIVLVSWEKRSQEAGEVFAKVTAFGAVAKKSKPLVPNLTSLYIPNQVTFNGTGPAKPPTGERFIDYMGFSRGESTNRIIPLPDRTVYAHIFLANPVDEGPNIPFLQEAFRDLRIIHLGYDALKWQHGQEIAIKAMEAGFAVKPAPNRNLDIGNLTDKTQVHLNEDVTIKNDGIFLLEYLGLGHLKERVNSTDKVPRDAAAYIYLQQ